MSKPTVFISSSQEGLEIAREFARQLEPSAAATVWSEGAFHPGKTVIESLTEAADRADFAIFVLTADDTLSWRRARSRSSRYNVIFEIGFLAGRLGLSRTFLAVADPGKVEMPSDLLGIMYTPLPVRPGPDLAERLAPAVAAIRKVIGDAGVRSDRSSEFFSCFISYSWNDKDFAAQLYDDLRKVGVRCWLDAKEMKLGDSILDQIDRAIQVHDKVLLVLSEASVRSSWVRQEIKNAFGLERARDSTILFPLRLDDAVLATRGTEEISRLRNRFIIDFSDWQDRTQYQRAFSRLVRALAISVSVESGRHE